MAGGVSYRCAALTLGGTSLYDIRSGNISQTADMIYNQADCRKWPQQAASTNHRSRLSVNTLDLSNGEQESSSAPLIGSAVGSAVLTISNTSSGTMTYTQNPSVCINANVDFGPQDGLAELAMEFEAAGTGGNEPNVSWIASV